MEEKGSYARKMKPGNKFTKQKNLSQALNIECKTMKTQKRNLWRQSCIKASRSGTLRPELEVFPYCLKQTLFYFLTQKDPPGNNIEMLVLKNPTSSYDLKKKKINH